MKEKLRGVDPRKGRIKSPNRGFLTLLGTEAIVGMREALGLSVNELAVIYEVKPDTIMFMERGWLRISETYFQFLLKLYQEHKRANQVQADGGGQPQATNLHVRRM